MDDFGLSIEIDPDFSGINYVIFGTQEYDFSSYVMQPEICNNYFGI